MSTPIRIAVVVAVSAVAVYVADRSATAFVVVASASVMAWALWRMTRPSPPPRDIASIYKRTPKNAVGLGQRQYRRQPKNDRYA